MFVCNRMTADPVTITSVTTIADAVEIMRSHKFRRLPVVDGGKLVGIVTDRDLRTVSPSQATSLSVHELNYLLAKLHVKEIMQRDVVTIAPDAAIEEAALLMYNHKIGGLVVRDAAGGAVGVITETDLFKTFVDMMGLTEGKTRLTIDLADDRVGALHEITAVFAALGLNISSMVTCPLPDGRKELIIRIDESEIEELKERLAAKGYPVIHAVEIRA